MLEGFLNSETIVVIVGIACLLLTIASFLFVPQISLMLKRLARIEFRSSEKPTNKTVNITPKDTKPWTWYKTWTTTLFHPSTYTGKAL
jgi:hypothetical protein